MLASSLAIPCKKACMRTNYPNPAEEGRDSTTATLLPNPTTTAAAAPAATATATAANHSIEELPKDAKG